MSKINTGGPAFPHDRPAMAGNHGTGMTLRDYFAAKAMHGLMGRNWSSHTGTDQELIDLWARSAYGLADAMLKAREGGAA